MTDKIFKVKKGSRVIIEVAKSRNEASLPRRQPTSQSKGIIKSRRDDDYPARRKKPDGGINFIDLGQIAVNDVFTRITAMFVPDVTVFSDTILAMFNVEDEDLENFVGEIETQVFDGFGEDYAAKYYKIEKTDDPFSKSISAVFQRSGETVFEKLNDLAEWKAGGLVLNQSQVENLTIQPDGRLYAINNINFADLENDINRITLERNIEAENVEFAPSPKMDILLMPAALQHFSFTHYKDGIHTYTDGSTHSDFIRKGDYLNVFWNVLDRAFWQEIVAIDEAGLSTYQTAYRMWQIQKRFVGARIKRLTYDFEEESPFPYFTVISDEAVVDFPYDEIYQDADAPVSGGAGVVSEDFLLGIQNDLYELQKLKFIIRKNDEFYYFWKT